MVDVKSLDDVPTRVLDLLKIFLAASSRGERAVLVLETRSKSLWLEFHPFLPTTLLGRKLQPEPGGRSSDWKVS